MASKLDRLLDGIQPAKTVDQADRRADDAINSFCPRSALTENWNRFCDCLICFLRHTDVRLLRLRQECPMTPSYDWGRCCQILARAYGTSGEKTAFEMARTGNEGGLYAVLKKFARTMAEQYADNEILAMVSFYWNGLSIDEQFSACDEYLEKYGHLLPSEITEGNAVRVRANLPKVLQEHPRLIQHLSRIGRM